MCVFAAGALLLSACAPVSAEAEPRAVTVRPDSTVGALFVDATAASHGCTGTVLSQGHGLVLTAAHCLTGTGAGVRFIPGYDGTAADPAPLGVWTVSKVWAAAGWLTDREPAHDFAVLKVDDQDSGGISRSIDEVTGGHPISVVDGTDGGAGPALGPVTVIAYNAGTTDAPVGCTTGGRTDPVPTSFRCDGYSIGTSGAPWLQKGWVKHPTRLVGIVGGPNQGGCTDAVSYSPTFDDQLVQLMSRAEADGSGDVVPAAGDDGC